MQENNTLLYIKGTKDMTDRDQPGTLLKCSIFIGMFNAISGFFRDEPIDHEVMAFCLNPVKLSGRESL